MCGKPRSPSPKRIFSREFWTGVNWKRDGFLDRLAGFSPRVRSELRRRSFLPELAPFVRTDPAREWLRLAAEQLGWKRLTRDERAPFSIDAVYRSLDRRVAERIASGLTIKAVYAYDDGALASFRAARERGIKCIYEHPVVSWRVVRQLQREEAELHPEWAPTLGALRDSEEKLARKDEELALADVVVTASSFARESVLRAPRLKAPVAVIPYGTQRRAQFQATRVGLERKVACPFRRRAQPGKRPRLPASKRSRAGSARSSSPLIGRRVSPTIPAPSLLDKYRWIPSLPHDELLQEMSRHDVLVLPSLHEGFGLVMTEAMAQGLVVITTPHTAGPDLITDGVDGFIVPIRSAAAIEEKLALLLREPDRLRGDAGGGAGKSARSAPGKIIASASSIWHEKWWVHAVES